ncbi:hypothetical protein AWB65_04792 [Caballeronia humi]|uniref:Uncharacterized protein n=1 Tax=Caballeronia humi TaxID=326474 RepID=A0A158IGQ9_9BURK|nr:hypothetical protein AWB65_04792 [Caballeronia humi]
MFGSRTSLANCGTGARGGIVQGSVLDRGPDPPGEAFQRPDAAGDTLDKNLGSQEGMTKL